EEAGAPQRITLPVADFLQRWLLHVPIPQTRGVRSYGLYHPSHAAALAGCRAARGQPPLGAPAALDWQRVGGKPIRSGVPPVASGSCVLGLSRVGVYHRLYWLGSARHEADTRQAAGGD